MDTILVLHQLVDQHLCCIFHEREVSLQYSSKLFDWDHNYGIVFQLIIGWNMSWGGLRCKEKPIFELSSWIFHWKSHIQLRRDRIVRTIGVVACTQHRWQRRQEHPRSHSFPPSTSQINYGSCCSGLNFLEGADLICLINEDIDKDQQNQ